MHVNFHTKAAYTTFLFSFISISEWIPLYLQDKVTLRSRRAQHMNGSRDQGDRSINVNTKDSSGQMTSSPLGSPTSHRGMHPSLLSPGSMGHQGPLHSPISSLSSPINGLGSPFSVISSPMGPHSMTSPGMGYGPSVSPQVSPVTERGDDAFKVKVKGQRS
ncbi:unnamed protein product [Arctogadus glacialis]